MLVGTTVPLGWSAGNFHLFRSALRFNSLVWKPVRQTITALGTLGPSESDRGLWRVWAQVDQRDARPRKRLICLSRCGKGVGAEIGLWPSVIPLDQCPYIEC